MKISAATYAFDKAAKTITFSGIIPATLDKILAVVNTTSGILIYAPNNPAVGGTYASPVLTLTYDTSAMANTDKLLIYLEDGNSYYTVGGSTAVGSAPTNPPLSVSGIDGGGLKRHMLLGVDGSMIVGASENHIGEFGERIASIQASFTRPADANPYVAKDVISDSTSAPTVITFTNMARVNGGSGWIIKSRLRTDLKTCVANIRLHLYNAAPTAINDNAPCTTLWADRTTYMGYIDFPALACEDPTNSTAASSLNKDDVIAFVCGGGSKNLYGIAETLTAFTPASAENFFVELTVNQN